MTDLATTLTRMSNAELHRWITGTNDWHNTRQASARILDLPDEAYAEAERRSEHLATLRDILNDLAEDTEEWQAAADAYSRYFIEWVTGSATA